MMDKYSCKFVLKGFCLDRKQNITKLIITDHHISLSQKI